MIIPYFLKTQQAALSAYTADVAKRKVETNALSVAGCKQALEQANHTYALYTIATQNVFGKVKSFIPFTAAFSYRIRCAKNIDTALSLLKQVDNNIKQAVIASKAPVKVDSANDAGKCFGSPINYGNRNKKQHNLRTVNSAAFTLR